MRIILFVLSTLILSIFSSAAMAQQVTDCTMEGVDIRTLAEPWEENSRTFANGDVRIAVMDTWDPANYPMHLIILFMHPDSIEAEGRTCIQVSDENGWGFQNMFLREMKTTYDPAKGLTFIVPVERSNGDGTVTKLTLWATLNRASGQVTAGFQ